MAEKQRWQYCQIEVGTNSSGQLKQFFPDRSPIVTDLRDQWGSMLAKLGDQGWDMVAVFPNEGGRGRSPLTYVFKRPLSAGTSFPAPPPPIDDEDDDPGQDFEPLRGV